MVKALSIISVVRRNNDGCEDVNGQFKAGKNSVSLSDSIWNQDYNQGLVHEAVVAL